MKVAVDLLGYLALKIFHQLLPSLGAKQSRVIVLALMVLTLSGSKSESKRLPILANFHSLFSGSLPITHHKMAHLWLRLKRLLLQILINQLTLGLKKTFWPPLVMSLLSG